LRWKVLLWKEEDDMFSVMEYELLESFRKHTMGEARYQELEEESEEPYL
jgi:hypothetical protein